MIMLLLMSTTPCLVYCHNGQQEPIHTSLLRMIPEHTNRAVKIFVGILRYCGDAAGSEVLSQAQAIEIAQKLLHQVCVFTPPCSSHSLHIHYTATQPVSNRSADFTVPSYWSSAAR